MNKLGPHFRRILKTGFMVSRFANEDRLYLRIPETDAGAASACFIAIDNLRELIDTLDAADRWSTSNTGQDDTK